jgi:hypothetical protein
MKNVKKENRDDVLPHIKRYWAYIVKNKWTIIVSVGAILIVLLIDNFQSMAQFLFDKKNANGEFLKVIFTGISGIAIFYGLWLNQKRIKGSENSNFDKRFSDAVGYLGRNNTTTILGGIHTLHQLAKEDIRYRSIVADLLCSYLRGNYEKLYKEDEERQRERTKIQNEQGCIPDIIETPPIIMQTILDVLFNNKDSAFENENLDLSGAHLKYVKFNGDVKNCNFDLAELESCIFNNKVYNSIFDNTKLLNCEFSSSIDSCDFKFSSIENCCFGKIYSAQDSIKGCSFYMSSIEESKFCVAKITDCHLYFSDCDNISFNETTFKNTIIENYPDQIHYNDCPNRPTKLEKSND